MILYEICMLHIIIVVEIHPFTLPAVCSSWVWGYILVLNFVFDVVFA